ncbi:MAG: hypothetical protein KAR19_02165 [Bacteroidales bacterium]|nr:hypothetical protein [Bacteroidales bacterium]
MQEGPIDLCILGLGMNGHLAFNEPAGFLSPNCHVAKLSDMSLNHPMVSKMEGKPAFGLTLGMADILNNFFHEKLQIQCLLHSFGFTPMLFA